jgi:hypothetical protein
MCCYLAVGLRRLKHNFQRALSFLEFEKLSLLQAIGLCVAQPVSALTWSVHVPGHVFSGRYMTMWRFGCSIFRFAPSPPCLCPPPIPYAANAQSRLHHFLGRAGGRHPHRSILSMLYHLDAYLCL